MVERGGFYRTSDQTWVHLERIQFVGACNPPTDPGRKPLSQRFLRHAPVIYVDYPGATSLKQIYGTFNRAMLRLFPALRGYAESLTSAMVEFYLESQVHNHQNIIFFEDGNYLIRSFKKYGHAFSRQAVLPDIRKLNGLLSQVFFGYILHHAIILSEAR